MTEPRTHMRIEGNIAHIRFDNPTAYNALTSEMWEQLRQAALSVAENPDIRVVVFRGVGGKAFVSGTDISGFTKFTSGADGVAYEAMIDRCMDAVDRIPVTTIAVVDGWAVGGGMNISAASDFRIATADARFGSPIGRTLGNCLSPASLARIGGATGLPIAKKMLLLGEIVSASELEKSGFLYQCVQREDLEVAVETLCARAAESAPLTTKATKDMLRRLSLENLPDCDDIISEVYGSDDFRTGVKTFLARTKELPQWKGR